MDKVIIFDTTLRDGEQAAGGALTTEDKIEIARQLDRLGVDVIEAGFPISSKGELDAIRRIAKEVRRPIICALAHARREAIDIAWKAIEDAERSRIHVFLSSSQIHLLHQLKKDRQQVLEASREMVARAKDYLEAVSYTHLRAHET